MLALSLFILVTISHYVDSIQFLMDGPKNSDTYGPFDVSFRYFKPCPDIENTLANITTSLYLDQNVYKGGVNLTLNDAARIVEMKVAIHSLKNNHKKLIWDYSIEKPCLNRLVATALKKYVDLRSCVLRKGYHSTFVNFSESVKIFYGSSFFYGEYIAKFTLYSTRKQVILCVTADEIIVKKHN